MAHNVRPTDTSWARVATLIDALLRRIRLAVASLRDGCSASDAWRTRSNGNSSSPAAPPVSFPLNHSCGRASGGFCDVQRTGTPFSARAEAPIRAWSGKYVGAGGLSGDLRGAREDAGAGPGHPTPGSAAPPLRAARA